MRIAHRACGPGPPPGASRSTTSKRTSLRARAAAGFSPSGTAPLGSSEKWKKNCSEDSGMAMNPNESFTVATVPACEGSVLSRKATLQAWRRLVRRFTPTLSSTMSPRCSAGPAGSTSASENGSVVCSSSPAALRVGTCTWPSTLGALRRRRGGLITLPMRRSPSTSTARSSSWLTTLTCIAHTRPERRSSSRANVTASPGLGVVPAGTTWLKWKNTRPEVEVSMKPYESLRLITVPSSRGRDGSTRCGARLGSPRPWPPRGWL
mmetsp:Transcript_17185/g.57643  ORF Transcript_17185/g.57643 Transcript_17185/m.57643 type:complete len:264 (-) Transcript_17185:160-951(-)